MEYFRPSGVFSRAKLPSKRIGMLTPLALFWQTGGKWRVLCLCDCGNLKDYDRANLFHRTVSCGCHAKAVNTIHGHAARKRKGSEYCSWSAMKQRCTNSKHKHFSYYGGSGITVCDRWKHSFSNFIADMGMKPTPLHTIDRFPDPYGNYEPSNCRWATRKQQIANQRRRNGANPAR
jgi:hypothetical protein